MTTEKVLSFAYEMRNFYENYLKDTEKLNIPEDENKQRQLRELLTTIHPTYKIIYETIKGCEDEIAYNEAKSNGKNNEKKRTNAAKKLIKSAVKQRTHLNGFKRISDDEIGLANGFVLFKGKPIIGIEETTQPEKYVDVSGIIKNNNLDSEEQALNIDEIKTKFKCAKTEFKKQDCLFKITENAAVVIKNDREENVYFDSDKIILACDLIGGDKFTIQVGKYNAPCIIKGENGICLVCPFIPKN